MTEYKLSYTANEIDEKLKRIEDGGVGYTEPGKVLTFDGNLSGKEAIPGEVMGLSGVYVKVSNTAFAVDELQSVSATMVFDGVKETNEIPLSAITVQKDRSVAFLVQNEIPIAIVVAENFSSDELSMTVGTYFLCDENYLNLGTYYVSSITYGKETIVPIDPKYLPGVCLPVVELETAISDIPGVAAPLSENDVTAIKAVASLPFILSFTMDVVPLTAIMSGLVMGEMIDLGAVLATSTMGVNQLSVGNTVADGGWGIRLDILDHA